ncbi:hypothetical protein PS907_00773 [Pseudomonas fluorescens]|nr:hypothetical protein PS907_00773 [Pseudomonas fluorescens]
MAVYQSPVPGLTHRYREQAPSHIWTRLSAACGGRHSGANVHTIRQ